MKKKPKGQPEERAILRPDSCIERFRATFAPAAVDEKKRMIECDFYSGATVQRMDYWTGEKYFLTLSLDPKHVNLDRLNSGAPVLDEHMNYSVENVLGVVEKGWIANGTGKALLRFSEREEVEPVWQDVKSGILRNVSMGVQVNKLQDVTPDEDKLKQYLAVDWEVAEISLVGVPADPGAGFLSAQLGRIDLTGIRPEPPTDGREQFAEPGAASRQALLALFLQRMQWQ